MDASVHFDHFQRAVHGVDLRQILRHYEPGLSRPEVNQRDVRARVDAAWLAGDWDGVTELLRTVPSEQRPRADAKRLEIAERRVRG
jgi:hypothetical protein